MQRSTFGESGRVHELESETSGRETGAAVRHGRQEALFRHRVESQWLGTGNRKYH